MILMRVDLPAPLSPSTQVTSPALTARLMPFSARMAPWVLPTFSIYTRGSPLCRVSSAWSAIVSVMSADLSCARQVLDVQVDHDRQEQHDPEERPEPVGVPAGVHDAEAGHAEDEGADRDTDAVAVSAGEQGSADHRGDDVKELVTYAVAGLQHVEVVEVVHSGEPGKEGDCHEQSDLDTYDRH